MKRPAFQFYPADWRKDAAVQACSMAARGLWHEMLCIAHECDPYGYLTVNGAAMTSAQLARLVGEGAKDVQSWLTELEAAGVFSRDDEGRIYSRRMVKDERLRNVRADAGRLGGNPRLVGGKVNQNSNHAPNHDANQSGKQSPTPSSSSSSSSSKPKVKSNVGLPPDDAHPGSKPADPPLPPDAQQPPPTGRRAQAIEVLTFLNAKTGRDYQPVPANLDLIAARLKEGATVEDCRAVIARKWRDWQGNDEMRQYARPATLFNATKFAQYRGECVAEPEPA